MLIILIKLVKMVFIFSFYSIVIYKFYGWGVDSFDTFF